MREKRTVSKVVERTEEVAVCDSCGTAEDELPELVDGGFREVYIGKPEIKEARATHGIRVDVSNHSNRLRTVRVGLENERRDLCPICYGAILGDD